MSKEHLAHNPITYLSLLRKYNGDIMLAHELEMKAAARTLKEGENALTALFAAQKEYAQSLASITKAL